MAVTIAVYAPVRHYPFVSFDDQLYVSENRQVAHGLTPTAIAWAFTTDRAANWHPVTWLSHLCDVQMYGLNAGPHHVTNLVLHLLNTLLLFWVLRRMTRATGRSALVAALFAVHPLHVESVAWIAERKDVLSTFFWMLTIWAYVGYQQRRTWLRYGLVAVPLALGLMAKPMLVTAPFALLLLDVWPLGRAWPGTGGPRPSLPDVVRQWVPLFREKVPLFALAVASSAVTFVVQRQGGAVGDFGTFPFAGRVANALVSYVAYIGKMIWPMRLLVFYPYPTSAPVWPAFVALVALVGVSVLAVRLAARRPYLAFGWFWYLATLLPTVGIVQVGAQALADRYTYVPLIGLFVIVAWGVPDLVARWRVPRLALSVAAAAAILACAAIARAQVTVWSSSEALWQHALALDADNYRAHDALGLIAAERGHTIDAMTHFSEAIRLEPGAPDPYNDLGLMLARQGRFDEAVAHYQFALQLKPRLAEAHNNLGMALASQGKLGEAIVHYTEALRIDPDVAAFHSNFGQALAARGRVGDAIAEYDEALRIKPRYFEAHGNLGLALASQGRIAEAIAHYQEALRITPASADTHANIGLALAAEGKLDEAIDHYREALRLEPGRADIHDDLGFALAAQEKIAEATPHFTEAIRLQPGLVRAHYHLGLVLAATGRLDEAAAEFSEVLRMDPGHADARRALDKITGRRRPSRSR
jgi:tetratricopeptide (TPR) repeat protein